MKAMRGMEDTEGLASRLLDAARDVSKLDAGYRPSASEIENFHTIMQWQVEPERPWVIWGKHLNPGQREYSGEPVRYFVDVLFCIDVENKWALTLSGFFRLQDRPEGPRTDAWEKSQQNSPIKLYAALLKRTVK